MTKTVVHVLTVPDSLVFLAGQAEALRRAGWRATVVCSPGDALDAFGGREGVETHGVAMGRAITPLRDLRALVELVQLMREVRPDAVHAQTPKGGLLGSVAGWLSGVPVRVYHMRGLPFVTARGPKRALLRATERLACRAATRVVCHSASLRDVAESEGLVAPGEALVLGGNGVDARGRFDPTRFSAEHRHAIRAELGIPPDARVVVMVARLVRDKGVIEMQQAWATLHARFPDAHLLLVGPFEPRDPVPMATRSALERDPSVHLVGFRTDTERMYAAADVAVLPTYREGFPNVPLEAAAMSLPVVATRVTGCIDAVADGVTGTLVPPRDAESLSGALAGYLAAPDRASRHGAAGRERVLREFAREHRWAALLEEYEGGPLSAPDGRRRTRTELLSRT